MKAEDWMAMIALYLIQPQGYRNNDDENADNNNDDKDADNNSTTIRYC